jgi:uncharacterized protein (TIGR03435 family)
MSRALASLFILLAAHALAQAPAFEAATIKPSKDTPGHSGSHSRTGMIMLSGQTLKGLICSAYRVKDFQVSGGPKWLDQDRYDVNAKAEGAAEGERLLQMLQTLLADRFQLVIHREQKIAPAYALVLAKSGMKIKPVEGAEGSKSRGGKGELEVKGMTMADLADYLSKRVGTLVADQTGTTGAFDFKLQWSTEGNADDSQAALFSALQSEIGVKVESRKLPMDLIVVDKAEKPSEN